MKKFLPFLILLVIAIITISCQLSTISRTNAQDVTYSATVLSHLSWERQGNNLVISTNEPEGFTLITREKIITKKGPVVFTVPYEEGFSLIANY